MAGRCQGLADASWLSRAETWKGSAGGLTPKRRLGVTDIPNNEEDDIPEMVEEVWDGRDSWYGGDVLDPRGGCHLDDSAQGAYRNPHQRRLDGRGYTPQTVAVDSRRRSAGRTARLGRRPKISRSKHRNEDQISTHLAPVTT